LNDICEIINPVILRDAMRELPSVQRPENDLWLRPHAILNNVEKSGSVYKDHMRIFASLEKIKTDKKEEKAENSCMGNNATICDRIRKKNPANHLIDNIRQDSAEPYKPVWNAKIRSKISEDEKYPGRNSKMSQKKHDFIKGFMNSKMLSLNVY